MTGVKAKVHVVRIINRAFFLLRALLWIVLLRQGLTFSNKDQKMEEMHVVMKSVNGDSFPLSGCDDDVLLPTSLVVDVRKKMADILQLPYQDGDLLLCSYPKSGTHWVFHMIAKLVHGRNIDEPPPLTGLLEIASEGLDSLPSPRILVSHLHPKRLPKSHWENGKVILVIRNPKDIAVSLYSHLSRDAQFALLQTWEEFLDGFLKGEEVYRSCFDYFKAWDKVVNDDKKGNVCVLYYEELKANPMENMKRLQKHLGVDHSEETLEKIIDECSLPKLRESLQKQESGYKRIDGESQRFFDKDGTSVIYRKGIVADWKNHFTVAQNEAFEKVIEEQLKNIKFNFIYV